MGLEDRWVNVDGRVVVAAVALVALALGIIQLKRRSDQQALAEAPANLQEARLLERPDAGPALLVSAGVHQASVRYASSTERLELFDLADGHLLARTPVEHSTACVAASPGLAWCDTQLTSGSTLHLRDTATLAVHTTHAQVEAAAPPLSKETSPRVDGVTGEAWMTTSDGRAWHVDPRTLDGGVAARPPDGLEGIGHSPSSIGSRSVVTAAGDVFMEGSPRSTPQLKVGRDGHRALTPGDWLDPEFLVDVRVRGAKRTALTVGPGLLLLKHVDSVDRATAQASLTALDLEGKTHWTARLGHFEVAGAWEVGDQVVVALRRSRGPGSVVSLDVADGHQRWVAVP